MKRCCYMLVLIFCLAGICLGSNQPRETDFNFDWKFSLQEEAADAVDYDDTHWRSIRLPHDWSVEASFDPNLEGCTGYLPGGLGWYRKHFTVNAEKNEVTYLLFDGVYNNCDVWLNGTKLGFHPYGYSPFYYDIAPNLQDKGKTNVLAVYVDRSRYADSRWYTGSGIYRNVKLVTVNKLHIPIWGTFITTPDVSKDRASIQLEIKVKNAYEKETPFVLTTVITDPKGKKVAEQNKPLRLGPNEEQAFKQSLTVSQPTLWDTEHPALYKAVTSIIRNDVVIDEYVTPFGIRTIRFDPDYGFFLNGKETLLKGVCLHHDGGLVGAAVPKGVWRRRLETLREAGCNAIRTAHNPPSEEFLDLCDELGMLVQDEFFDEMDNPKDKRRNMDERSVDYITRGYHEHFQEWAERDLKTSLMRDRNHPSVVQWSIGNEIEWTYPRYKHATGFWEPQHGGNYWNRPPHYTPEEIRKRYEESTPGKYVLADTAKKLAAWTRELDTTRPVTANCILPSASHVTGYTDALDVVGYSYHNAVYDYSHKHFPDKPVTGTETGSGWQDWKAVFSRPFVSSMFMWTGIAYMGESNGGWPRKGSGGVMLDFAGFKRSSWHRLKTYWTEEPHVYLSTQPIENSRYKVDEMTGLVVDKETNDQRRRRGRSAREHWNYEADQTILVEVLSNCDMVELLLNGRSLGMRSLSDFQDRVLKWAVPFEAGTLTARVRFAGKTATSELVTTSEPVGIVLSTDKTRLKADAYDVAHIVAQLVDKNGTPVKIVEKEIVFETDGPARVLGVDNGASSNVQDYQSDRVNTSQGRCLLIVQSNRTSGKLTVRARSGELSSQTLVFNVQ